MTLRRLWRVALATFTLATVGLAPAVRADIPHMPDGRPNFAGRYNARASRGGEKPVFKGEYLKSYNEVVESIAQGRPVKDTGAACATIGNGSSLMYNPYGTEIVQTPSLMIWHFEGGDGVRRIYLDGRTHPKTLRATGMGHSIGRFEGDTLVIDTVGYTPTRLTPDGDFFSEKLHVVERVHFVNDGKDVEIELTADDADALAKPWNLRHTLMGRPQMHMLQWDCEENNRNRPDENGVTGVQGIVK